MWDEAYRSEQVNWTFSNLEISGGKRNHLDFFGLINQRIVSCVIGISLHHIRFKHSFLANVDLRKAITRDESTLQTALAIMHLATRRLDRISLVPNTCLDYLADVEKA